MKKTKKKSLRVRLAEKKLEFFVFFLVVSLTLVVLWPYITTTVEAGYVGAYYSRFFGGTDTERSYKEGIHFVLPWDKIIQYDSRAQSKTFNIAALTKGGLNVSINLSAIWYIDKEKVGDLHKNMGPDYADIVIEPALASVVRSTLGGYQQGELYDGKPMRLQEDVLTLLKDTLRDAPFAVHSILVREVKLPDGMVDAIAEKFITEQNVLAERYRVLEAFERFKRNYVDAESVNMSQSIISKGLTENYLRYLGIQATLALSESDNAKLVIIGDKDGLPLILNTDNWATSDGIAENTSGDVGEHTPQERLGGYDEAYTRIEERLKQMDGTIGILTDRFPTVSDTFDTTLPAQTDSIPKAPNTEGTQ